MGTWPKNEMPIDRRMLHLCLAATIGKKRYGWGYKPKPGSDSHSWLRTDCSGYVRWMISRIAGVTIPMGSIGQRAWFAANNFKVTSYEHAGLDDGRLRVGVWSPGWRGAGHIWMVLNGRTIESYGGHGPGRNPWDIYRRRVEACFVLTGPPE